MLLDILSVLSGLQAHSFPRIYKIQLIPYAAKVLLQRFFSPHHYFSVSPFACQAHLVLRQDSLHIILHSASLRTMLKLSID